jgi:hypothetical protein
MFQKAGYCMRCNDVPCYEVQTLWTEGERYPGEPKRLGAPAEGVKVSFILMDGSRADMQICERCEPELSPADYPEMWARALRSWKREMDFTPSKQKTAWWESQFANGILAEMGRRNLKDLADG